MKKRIIPAVFIILSIALLCAILVFVNSNKNNSEQNNKTEQTNVVSEKNSEIKTTNKVMEQNNKLELTSEAFENNQSIPKQYSCNGENINPPLLINNVPEGTKSLALIVDDPDAVGGEWVHWLIWNIPANTSRIDAGSVPVGSIQGLDDFKKHKYGGPCPPSGTHRYFFKLYALDLLIALDRNSNKSDLENAMNGHILDQTVLVGLYSKIN